MTSLHAVIFVIVVALAFDFINGFHDAALKGLAVDYERRTVRFDLVISVGNATGPACRISR